ncbi:MAG: DUF503 domain-containing protein [Chloroflexota bacterium]
MIVGVGYVEIQVFEAHSLKEKRRVVRSLVERTRNRFNASISEVNYQDVWQMAGIGITCASTSSAHADQMLAEIINFIERNVLFGSIVDVHTELIPWD